MQHDLKSGLTITQRTPCVLEPNTFM